MQQYDSLNLALSKSETKNRAVNVPLVKLGSLLKSLINNYGKVCHLRAFKTLTNIFEYKEPEALKNSKQMSSFTQGSPSQDTIRRTSDPKCVPEVSDVCLTMQQYVLSSTGDPTALMESVNYKYSYLLWLN